MKSADELLDFIARNEGGEHGYSSFNPNDNNQGIAFGAWQFNQRKGSLPKLLRMMHEADPGNFTALFADILFDSVLEHPEQHLLDETWVRKADLSKSPWPETFRAAGQWRPFQAVQRDLARTEYLEPAVKVARSWLLMSERAAAMAFDVAVQYGIEGLKNRLALAIGMAGHDQDPLGDPPAEREILGFLAATTDLHTYDADRRHKLLRSPALSDAPWTGLEEPGKGRPVLRQDDRGPAVDDLRRLLQAAGYTITRPKDPKRADFGPMTKHFVEIFQYHHDLKPDGIVGPLTWAALEAAAKGDSNA